MIFNNSIDISKSFSKNDKDVENIIRNYFKCCNNNRWKDFDFQHACAILLSDIQNVLSEYGYFGKEESILYSLVSKFPCLSSQELEMQQKVYREFRNKGLYYSFDCPYLCAYIKLEDERFIKLQNKYKDNLDLISLGELYGELKATMNHGINSQEEAIELIHDALYARFPKGAIFNLDV